MECGALNENESGQLPGRNQCLSFLVLVFVISLSSNIHSLLKSLWKFTTSGLREEEGEDANNDATTTHDEEGEEVCHSVQISNSGSQQRSKPGKC